jgi:hypothetical protein
VLRHIGEYLRVALETLLRIDPCGALELVTTLNMAWWIQGKLREGIDWLQRALALAHDAPAELRASARFSEGFLIAHDTDDWHAAAKQIDLGIDLLERTGAPSHTLAMLLCLRGECDVFPEAAVARTRRGLEMVRTFDVRENFAATELQLTAAELAQIAGLDQGFRFIAGAFWGIPGSPWTLENLWDEPTG